MSKCIGIKKDGSKCNFKSKYGDYCGVHKFVDSCGVVKVVDDVIVDDDLIYDCSDYKLIMRGDICYLYGKTQYCEEQRKGYSDPIACNSIGKYFDKGRNVIVCSQHREVSYLMVHFKGDCCRKVNDCLRCY